MAWSSRCSIVSAAIIALACGSSGNGAGAATQGGTANNGGGAGPTGGSSSSTAGTTTNAGNGGSTSLTAGNGGAANGGSSSMNGGTGGQPANGGNNPGGGAAGETPVGGSGGVAVPVGEGDLGPAEFAQNEIDAASTGATITFQNVGSPGWYPSRRDPSSGMCDIVNTGECCMTQHDLATDQLTPWNEELSMTLRGPMVVKQIVAYQPGAANTWARVSAWDSRGTAEGIAFWGNDSENGFSGQIGSVCEVEVAPNLPYTCGAGSSPYCVEGGNKYYGFAGSKLLVVLGWTPHAGTGVIDGAACGDATHNWHDAPWIGLTHGELVRSGRYSGCHCWSKPGPNPYSQDGCGQFNVFEVVNDNNDFANFDLFSTNLVSYAGYIGEGPCGNNCDTSGLAGTVDLLDKTNGGNSAATAGAVSGPGLATGAAFVRPDAGYRYFIVLLDEVTRTVQIGLVHPSNVPASINTVLPNFPLQIPRSTIDALLSLRLPG